MGVIIKAAVIDFTLLETHVIFSFGGDVGFHVVANVFRPLMLRGRKR